jgi:glucokinase
MTALAIDLGGTKLSLAVFTDEGQMIIKKTVALQGRAGGEVGDLIDKEIKDVLAAQENIGSIGVAVPGIYHEKKGTVWAPNIKDWDNYPLLDQLQKIAGLHITIDSDRACYILGEAWKGNAANCRHAIYLAVGTGIGAGILVDGVVLRGVDDIAGAIGWMALKQPFDDKYVGVGNFEYYASGDGIARLAKELLAKNKNYEGVLVQKTIQQITAHDVFDAYEKKDQLAKQVFEVCIHFWGMAAANLVSLFNPEKIIFGGGVFGPAVQFLDAIRTEATKWAQPISVRQVSIEPSALGTDAGLYGAALLAFRKINIPGHKNV